VGVVMENGSFACVVERAYKKERVLQTRKGTLKAISMDSTATTSRLGISYLSYRDTSSYAPFSSEPPRPLSPSPSYLSQTSHLRYEPRVMAPDIQEPVPICFVLCLYLCLRHPEVLNPIVRYCLHRVIAVDYADRETGVQYVKTRTTAS
jgi:hypothetical protein